MLHPSTQKLIQKLCELTESGDIAWKEARGQAPGSQVSIFETEGYKVEVTGDPPAVRLLSSDGRELEKAEAADLALPWPGGKGDFASHVADMSRRAHRVALGAEQAISKILSSLSAPPVKTPEPESRPTPVSTAESAAAIAAVSADLTQQRREPEPPPSPHTVAAAPPEPVKTATAVASVLAAEPVSIEPEPAVEAAEEELPLEDAPPALVAEAPRPPAEPAPTVQADTDRAFPLRPAAPLAPTPKPAPQPEPTPQRPAFGSTTSFAAAYPSKSAPPPPPPKPPGGQLFVTGFSSSVTKPATAPQPTAPKPEPESAGAPRKGPDVYKPWS
jgi:hypothetical protein